MVCFGKHFGGFRGAWKTLSHFLSCNGCIQRPAGTYPCKQDAEYGGRGSRLERLLKTSEVGAKEL